MTEPQVWTIIGVMAAAVFGLMTIVSVSFIRVMRAEFARLEARFDAVDSRMDSLDREIQGIVKHLFGFDRG